MGEFKKIFKIIKFWCVAFAVIMWNVIRKRYWHMIFVDFHLGDTAEGHPIRKQLIARRRCEGFELYWQDLNQWLKK